MEKSSTNGAFNYVFFPPWRFNPNVGWYFVGQDSKTMVPECDFRTPIILELSGMRSQRALEERVPSEFDADAAYLL